MVLTHGSAKMSVPKYNDANSKYQEPTLLKDLFAFELNDNDTHALNNDTFWSERPITRDKYVVDV